jgi:transcriptional regulator GlxA family with amidase domain
MTRRRDTVVAVVLYPSVSLLDVAAPLEVLLHAGRSVRPVLVAARAGPVPTEGPVALAPSHTFAELPAPAGLVVPGGGLGTVRAMVDDDVQSFLAASAARAEAIVTIGTGALPLAATGLLAGRRVAGHWGYRSLLARLDVDPAPGTVAEDGRFLSAAGPADATEPTLRLVARLAGPAAATAARAALEATRPTAGDGATAGPATGDETLPHLSERDALARRAAMRLILAARPDLLERLGP